ncbi:MAG: hypothetical protein J7J01_07960 [Methanophagales archaeon]|nr:hypothetical protein [Methanophagales archaeon]
MSHSASQKNNNLYPSQYIGNTFHYPTLEFLASSKEQMMGLLGLRMDEIDAIGADMHPRYSTRRYGKKLTEEYSIELVEIAADTCVSNDIPYIGITGGVSYDIPIVRMTEELVKEKGLMFLTHDRIPNGDEGISIGQNVVVGHLNKLSHKESLVKETRFF